MIDLNTTRELKRNIVNRNGFIELNTEYVDDLEYAFYLTHTGGLEKKMYTKKPNFCFKNRFVKGSYTATFFYKCKEEVKSYWLYFDIDENNRIVSKFCRNNVVEKEGYKIDFYDLGASKTFIVFNGAKSLKTSKPFGLSYLMKNGFNVITCLQNNNQYQELSFEDMESYVGPLVKDKDVYLYGSSLGGYCALYYAGAVNGTVIASAPRNSAHPILIKYSNGKSSFDKSKFRHQDFNDNRQSEKKIYIFFDPYVSADVYFIDKLVKTSFTNYDLISCDFAGHEVLYHLNKTGQLSHIIKSITNNEDPVVTSIESAYTYFGRAKHAYSKNEYARAVCLSDKALEDEFISDIDTQRMKRFRQLAMKNVNETLS